MTAMAKILGRSHLNIANRRIFPIQYSFRVIYDPERRLHIFPRGVMAHCSKALRRPLLIGNLTAWNTLYRPHAKHKSSTSCQGHNSASVESWTKLDYQDWCLLGRQVLQSCENVVMLRRKLMFPSTG